MLTNETSTCSLGRLNHVMGDLAIEQQLSEMDVDVKISVELK